MTSISGGVVIMVLVVGSDSLFRDVRGRLSPNQRREVFNFQIDQANRFGFADWSTDNNVDRRIAEYLTNKSPFIYYRGGPNFNVFNAKGGLNAAVTEIGGLPN